MLEQRVDYFLEADKKLYKLFLLNRQKTVETAILREVNIVDTPSTWIFQASM